MKKKLYTVILILLMLSGCMQRKNPIVDENVPWDSSNSMDWFLSESVWTFNEDQEIVFIHFSKNVRMFKMTGKNYLENLGDCSSLQRYYVDYHEERNYPYLMIGDQSYDFLEIKENSFTLANFDNGKPCTFTRKEKGHAEIDGIYRHNGATYSISCFGTEGILLHEETGLSYSIVLLDEKRIQIQDTIFSDVPVYRWWEDEKGNLFLLSEGYEVSGMSNEEILLNFSVVELEKID